MPKETIHFEVNGQKVTLEVDPDELLVDVLRNQLELKGTKAGCRAGECGACSVIMDGKVVPSCLVPALKADGSKITTVEGLEKEGELHPLQKAFVEKGAIQCGFCTPGMLMAAQDLVRTRPGASRDEIRSYMSGNYCRCTGYHAIVDAVEEVLENAKGAKR